MPKGIAAESTRAAIPRGRAFAKGRSQPNHLHLIAVEPSAEVALAKLRAVMSGVRRSAFERKLVWERAPAVLVPDAFHLQRQLRYLALNPSRAGLVAVRLPALRGFAWVTSVCDDWKAMAFGIPSES